MHLLILFMVIREHSMKSFWDIDSQMLICSKHFIISAWNSFNSIVCKLKIFFNICYMLVLFMSLSLSPCNLELCTCLIGSTCLRPYLSPTTKERKQGCQTQFPGGHSVCRFLWFPFNQLSIKACIPRCVFFSQSITWMNQGCWEQPENQQTQRPSGTGVWHLCSRDCCA